MFLSAKWSVSMQGFRRGGGGGISANINLPIVFILQTANFKEDNISWFTVFYITWLLYFYLRIDLLC